MFLKDIKYSFKHVYYLVMSLFGVRSSLLSANKEVRTVSELQLSSGSILS